jgi:hypothetical protein
VASGRPYQDLSSDIGWIHRLTSPAPSINMGPKPSAQPLERVFGALSLSESLSTDGT